MKVPSRAIWKAPIPSLPLGTRWVNWSRPLTMSRIPLQTVEIPNQ